MKEEWKKGLYNESLDRGAYFISFNPDTTRNPATKFFDGMIDLLEKAANIKNDVSLEDLAGIAGYSAFHFARKFTLAMGIPPHRYISRKRLENAMAELAAGKLPLAEIALNAHFSSQASFTRAFHRATGMTPKAYQRSRF